MELEDLDCVICKEPMEHEFKVRGNYMHHERWVCRKCNLIVRVTELPKNGNENVLTRIFKRKD
jgi:hypothetical protein